MKNPFKKSSIVDTLVNVGIGGAANVAMDYVFNNIDMLSQQTDTTKNIIKIAAGALGGSMIRNKYGRAAVDGIAVVGVSNLIDSYINDGVSSSVTTETTAGLPKGTIGRLRTGHRGFRRAARISGASFMGK